MAKAMLDSTRGPGKARDLLAEFLGRRFLCQEVILIGSGTQALEMAMRLALGQRARGSTGPVALPAYSCFDVVTAAVGAGAPLLFYDVDPHTLAPDMDSLRETLLAGAGAVVVSSLCGFPVDWDAVRTCCVEAGAVLIEDAAQGLGSTWRGREGGTFGDLTVLSFGRGKGWTGGGGGALLVRGQVQGVEAADRALPPRAGIGSGLRAAMTTLGQWVFGRPELYGIPTALPWLGLGETTYRDPVLPFAIPSYCAALALTTAEASAREVMARRRTAARLRERLDRPDPSNGICPLVPLAAGESGYLRFPVLSGTGTRSILDSDGARSLGILRGYPRSLPELPVVSGLRMDGADLFPGALELRSSLFSLPTHSLVEEGDLAEMVRFLIRANPEGN